MLHEARHAIDDRPRVTAGAAECAAFDVVAGQHGIAVQGQRRSALGTDQQVEEIGVHQAADANCMRRREGSDTITGCLPPARFASPVW